MNSDTPSTIRPIRWLMLALIVWGIYVAIGTSRFAQNFSDSMWKGAIVLGCVVAFLGLWTVVLAAKRGSVASDLPDASQQGDQNPNRLRWSTPSVAGLAFAALGAICLVVFEAGLVAATSVVATALVWTAPMATIAALILAMIGLSDPLARRGKWLGMLALMAVLCMTVGWLYLQSSTPG